MGSAKNFSRRWGDHRKQLDLGLHCNRHLQHAWNKYTPEDFAFTIVESIDGGYIKKLFFERENFWIDSLKAQNAVLFNIARAEGGWGDETKSRSAEIGAKISATLRAQSAAMTAEQRRQKFGHLRGKPLSSTAKENLSEFWKGKPKPETTRKRMSAAQKSLTPEQKQLKAEHMSAVGRLRRGKSPKNAKPIFFRGKNYSSAPACRRATGLSMHTILQEVYGPDYRKAKKTQKL